MRVIIAGSRGANASQFERALDLCEWCGFVTAILSGGARGADRLGEEWARRNRLEVIIYPANWSRFGKRAGPLRNSQMARNSEGLIAIWDGKSRGTLNMIESAATEGLRIFFLRTDIDRHWDIPPNGSRGPLWEFAEERAAIMEFSGNVDRRAAERLAGLEARAKFTSITEKDIFDLGED